MKCSKIAFYLFLSILPLSNAYGEGSFSNQELIDHTEHQEDLNLDLSDEEVLSAIWSMIENNTSEDWIEIIAKAQEINPDLALHHGKYLGHPRNYAAEITSEQEENIRYIITTLASKSLITIAKNRSSLEKSGDVIDGLHPLKFLTVVFTDEELKVGIRNIRTRGWIWSDFVAGLKKSLHTESSNKNMHKEIVIDFAKVLNIDPQVILPAIHKNDWDEFINILIANVPRKGDHGRFDS